MNGRRMFTHLDLFSGIGGFSLAARWTGQIETVAFCEIDPFCQKVLKKHWPNVPIISDIREVTGERIRKIIADTEGNRWESFGAESEGQQGESGFSNGGQSSTDTTRELLNWCRESGEAGRNEYTDGNIDILTAGVPCQPASCAGKRKGTGDDRWLWPETFRVISEVKPTWCILENVRGLISLEGGLVFDDLLSTLETLGYEVQSFVIPACAVNAPHRRDRVWIVAHNAQRSGLAGSSGRIEAEQNSNGTEDGLPESSDRHAPDTIDQGLFRGSRGSNTNSNGIQEGEQTGGESRGATTRCDEDAPDTRSAQTSLGISGQVYGEEGNSGVIDNGGQERNGWEEGWLEVATRLCGIFNGVSHFLDEIGGLDGKKSIAVAGQDLPCLWQGFQQESFQWDIGGLDSIQFKANVFTVLWELFRKSYRQDRLSFESAEVQEAYLRNVWIGSEPGCPSQGWGYNEQYAIEHSNSLSQLSYEIALGTKEIIARYGKDRVNRLKALGNAIVPQVAYQILLAIIEAEEKTA